LLLSMVLLYAKPWKTARDGCGYCVVVRHTRPVGADSIRPQLRSESERYIIVIAEEA